MSDFAGARDEADPFYGSPEERLETWGTSHGDHVVEAAKAHHEDERPKRGMNGLTLRALEARNRRRARAAAGTDAEVERELGAVRPDGVTAAEKDDVIARKELEAQIEMAYGVEMTNNASKEYGSSGWKLPELQQIQGALADIPEEHLRMVESINRSGAKGGAGAMYNGTSHVMQVFDASFKDHTNTGIADGISGHKADRGGSGRYGAKAQTIGTSVADTFQHEVGHAVMAGHQDAYQHFIAAAGWQELGEKDLAKLPARERDALLQARKEADNKTGHSHDHDGNDGVVVDGKRFSVDKYSNGFQARDEAAMPADRRWGYAAASPEEHFAEVYAMALQVPEKLYEEMVAGPQRDFDAARDALCASHQQACGAEAVGDPRVSGPTSKQLADAQAAYARAEKILQSRTHQWQIMRGEVFGMTDQKVEAQARALKAQGASDDDLRRFKEEGGKAMTSKQLDRVSAKYAPAK